MAGIDTIHVGDTLRGKERDYAYIDELMGKLQVRRPDANVEVISYSNGGPKGLYMAEKYGLPHHTIDPVLGPKEVALLAKRGPDSAPLDLVRTNRPALASGMGQTAQQILTGDEAHINTINVAAVRSEGHPLTKIMDAARGRQQIQQMVYSGQCATSAQQRSDSGRQRTVCDSA
jgi:hypothetical protein